MIITIKSIIPIKYEQEQILNLCSQFFITCESYEKGNFILSLKITEDLDDSQIENIRKVLIQNILNNLILIERK